MTSTEHVDALGRDILVGDWFVRFRDRRGQVVMDAGRVTALVIWKDVYCPEGIPAVEAITCRNSFTGPRLHKDGKPVTIQQIWNLIVLDMPPDWAAETIAQRRDWEDRS